ncbi:RRP15-like protein [Pseudomyrmex gracilis]|uniref:RRP15-like protein n=1 Tax=Pseudomyrmex gracilis TaxID=219809 RepID=UPI0009951D00|nr:RRP15-like protein [Pseudomyrmex gracilis]
MRLCVHPLYATACNQASESGITGDSDYEKIEETVKILSNKEMEDDMNEFLHDGNSVSSGWADAMQKILKTNKPKRKKTIVLSKAKKLFVVKDKEKNISFEIDGAQDEKKTKSEKASANIKKISQFKQKSKEKTLGIRIKPSITDCTHERMLQKIATKGVVQLFNVVRQQQATISKKISEAGPLERKREKVLKSINKNTFLDLLMGNSKSISIKDVDKMKNSQQTNKNENKTEKIWSVLHDDFIMKAGLKNWDKKEDTEENSSLPEELNNDDDNDDE